VYGIYKIITLFHKNFWLRFCTDNTENNYLLCHLKYSNNYNTFDNNQKLHLIRITRMRSLGGDTYLCVHGLISAAL